MNDNWVNTDLLKQNNVTGKALFKLLIRHGVATVFDHNSLARITLNIGQGFD